MSTVAPKKPFYASAGAIAVTLAFCGCSRRPAGDAAGAPAATISLRADGAVAWNGETLATLDQFVSNVQRVAASSPSRPVALDAEWGNTYGEVFGYIAEELRKAGFTEVDLGFSAKTGDIPERRNIRLAPEPNAPMPVLQVTGEGVLYWNRELLSPALLPSRLKDLSSTGSSSRLIIAGDDSVRLGRVLQVIDLVKESGIEPLVRTRVESMGKAGDDGLISVPMALGPPEMNFDRVR